MDLIRGIKNFPQRYAPCVAAIGNFDGVHLGHQQLLMNLREVAQRYQLPTIIIIFEPHPLEVFNSDPLPARLTRLREKIVLLKQSSIDAVLIMHFNQALIQLSAQAFVEKILVNCLNIRALMVGNDFQFGYRRQGNLQMLEIAAAQYGFELCCMPTFEIAAQRISSTQIRKLLAADELFNAAALLGRPYNMLGKVVHGFKRGRLINFPTANIELKRIQSPLLGVYVVEMCGIKAAPVQGIANIGTRPTVNGTKALLEVHLFDFDQDIYGYQVQVNFLHKLRDEKRFDSFETLKAQIYQDAEAAKNYFKN